MYSYKNIFIRLALSCFLSLVATSIQTECMPQKIKRMSFEISQHSMTLKSFDGLFTYDLAL